MAETRGTAGAEARITTTANTRAVAMRELRQLKSQSYGYSLQMRLLLRNIEPITARSTLRAMTRT